MHLLLLRAWLGIAQTCCCNWRRPTEAKSRFGPTLLSGLREEERYCAFMARRSRKNCMKIKSAPTRFRRRRVSVRGEVRRPNLNYPQWQRGTHFSWSSDLIHPPVVALARPSPSSIESMLTKPRRKTKGGQMCISQATNDDQRRINYDMHVSVKPVG